MSTVLVVADERDIRELLRRYLERASHAVGTTGSGAEALRLLEEAQPDLVLDLGLPDVDGTEVLRAAQAPRTAVIALTARTAVEDRIRGLRLPHQEPPQEARRACGHRRDRRRRRIQTGGAS